MQMRSVVVSGEGWQRDVSLFPHFTFKWASTDCEGQRPHLFSQRFYYRQLFKSQMIYMYPSTPIVSETFHAKIRKAIIMSWHRQMRALKRPNGFICYSCVCLCPTQSTPLPMLLTFLLNSNRDGQLAARRSFFLSTFPLVEQPSLVIPGWRNGASLIKNAIARQRRRVCLGLSSRPVGQENSPFQIK